MSATSKDGATRQMTPRASRRFHGVQLDANSSAVVTTLSPSRQARPLATAESAAAASGGSLRETATRQDALAGAHVVYAKSWSSPAHYGDLETEQRLRAGLRQWCVDEDWFAPARPDCRFMHCLPVRRNVVVSDAVLDGPRSVVVHQARNRMWSQMAVLHELLKGNGR